jgi:hypothetical protein
MRTVAAVTLFALSLAFPLFVQAQVGNITMSGVVTDKQSHSSIQGATVTVVGGKANSANTDGEGLFILNFGPRAKEGEPIRIRIEKSGYQVYDATVALSSSIPLQVPLVRARSRPPVKTNAPPARPAKVVTKKDGFTLLIPVDTANSNMPIPLDENAEDPHAKFYRTLTFSITDRHPDKTSGYLMLLEDQLLTEEGRPRFLGKLIEVYIFDALFHMSRESYGVELSGGRVTPLDDKAVIPPDVVSSPTDHVIADLSERQLLTRAVELSLKNFPMHMPKGTNISFSEQVERQAVLYVIRMERPGFFKFDLTVRPIGNSNEGVLPDGFQTQAAKTVKTYDLIVAMESVIQMTAEDEFESDKYMTWTQDTFSELRRRMTF